MAKNQTIISNDDVLHVLNHGPKGGDPKGGNYFVDEDGNFVSHDTRRRLTRDPDNPNVLYDTTDSPYRGEGGEETSDLTVSLDVTPEGGISVTTSRDEPQMIFNPDGSTYTVGADGKKQLILSDEDVLQALNYDPPGGKYSVDENGNFVGSGRRLTRDPNNPNVLRDTNEQSVYQDGEEVFTANLTVTPERGISLTTSREEDPQMTFNPDGSVCKKEQNGTETYTYKDGSTYKIKPDGGEHYEYADGTQESVLPFSDGYSHRIIYPDNTFVDTTVEDEKVTRIYERDEKGNKRTINYDQNGNPSLIEYQTNEKMQFYKLGSDGQWHDISGTTNDAPFISGVSLVELMDMPPEKVSKYPVVQLQQELPTPQLPFENNEEKPQKKPTPKSQFTDKEVAFALDPKEGKVVIDKNGNFYNKSTSITYKRDPKNPDILHAHNPRNGKQKETITLKESEDGALVLQSSTGLKRTINPDLSFQEQFQAGTIKKPFDIDSKNPLEYSHEETHSYDKKGTRIKSLFKFIDGSTIEISAQKYLYRRPDGTVRYCKLMEPDGTSSSVSQDKDGKMSEWTFWDKDRKPLLKVKETKKSIQYLKMGSDKKWHVLPGIKDDFGKLGTAGLDKLLKMTPEEVDKLLKGRGQKVIPAPAPKEQLPLPPVFNIIKPLYEADSHHSVTNNVPQSVNIDRR